jgi:hypothetical protein
MNKTILKILLTRSIAIATVVAIAKNERIAPTVSPHYQYKLLTLLIYFFKILW